MPHLQAHAAVITLLNMLLLAAATYFVGRARGKYGVKAPATTGHEGFDRAFRAHMNTIEATVIFLPVLWLAALYTPVHWLVVAVAGYVWIAGRAWFLAGYLTAANRRGKGFTLATIAWLVLLIVAIWGVVARLLALPM
jgi:glutathione S-transferase